MKSGPAVMPHELLFLLGTSYVSGVTDAVNAPIDQLDPNLVSLSGVSATTIDFVASETLAKVEEKLPIITKTPDEVGTQHSHDVYLIKHLVCGMAGYVRAVQHFGSLHLFNE